MRSRNSLRFSLSVLAFALLSDPLLAKQALPPQITQAIKSWQQCAAAACQAQYDTVVARAGENGLKAADVRQALDKSKLALKKQMTAP